MLHQRYVLMRRGVEHHIRAVEIKERIEPIGIPNRAYLDVERQSVAKGALKLLLYIVGIVLVNIEDNEPFRGEPSDLTADLASDRASAAGDEHRFVRIVALYEGVVYLYAVAEEQVLYSDIVHLGATVSAVFPVGEP